MRAFSEFYLGIKHSVQAISFTSKHKLWKYFWLPAIISLGIFLGIGWLYWAAASQIVNMAEAYLAEDYGTTWLFNHGKWLLNVLIFLLTFVVYLKSYRVAMSIFLSPFLGNLAEKVQMILHPNLKESKFNFGIFLQLFFRGLVISLLNLFIELFFSISLLILGFIFPIISPFCTILALLIEWYFIGFSMIDLRNEIFSKSIGETYSMVWRRKFFSVSVGACYFVLFLIPFFGVFFAPCLATVAAGTGIDKLEKD